MAGFICPVCKSQLVKDDKTYRCEKNHCYDISRSGYINLLMSQKTSNHGDDKLMVKARRDFLDAGYYKILLDKLCSVVDRYALDGSVILDAGAGECYYTSGIYEKLSASQKNVTMLAVDISKNALASAKSRNKDIERAVASIFNIPVQDSSCDIVLNVFAPFCQKEFLRILKKSGIYIQVIPLENHLWELKKAVYDVPYKNTTEDYHIDGFELVSSREIKGNIKLDCTEMIENLFMMTPYYYKTSEKDFKKLHLLDFLKTQIEFAILIYKKK